MSVLGGVGSLSDAPGHVYWQGMCKPLKYKKDRRLGLTEWEVRKVTLPPRLGLILEVFQERKEGSPEGQESAETVKWRGLVRGSLPQKETQKLLCPWGRSPCEKLNLLAMFPPFLTLSSSPKPASLNWRQFAPTLTLGPLGNVWRHSGCSNWRMFLLASSGGG